MSIRYDDNYDFINQSAYNMTYRSFSFLNPDPLDGIMVMLLFAWVYWSSLIAIVLKSVSVSHGLVTFASLIRNIV